MNAKSKITKPPCVTAELKATEKGYGIIARAPDGSTAVYSDISRSREVAEDIADKINRGGVSPLHIDDIIEDLIG